MGVVVGGFGGGAFIFNQVQVEAVADADADAVHFIIP